MPFLTIYRDVKDMFGISKAIHHPIQAHYGDSTLTGSPKIELPDVPLKARLAEVFGLLANSVTTLFKFLAVGIALGFIGISIIACSLPLLILLHL